MGRREGDGKKRRWERERDRERERLCRTPRVVVIRSILYERLETHLVMQCAIIKTLVPHSA